MRYIIRSSNAGAPIALEKVEATKKQIIQSIVSAGRQYLAYSATLGSTNEQGTRIEEHVTVIEDVDNARIV